MALNYGWDGKIFFATIQTSGVIWMEHMDLISAAVVSKAEAKRGNYLRIVRCHPLGDEQQKAIESTVI